MTVPAPKSRLKAALAAVFAFALSPQARRYEIAFALGLYEAVRAALGNA